MNTPTTAQTLGLQGEQYVANYLKNNGFTILEYNYRTRQGEIDLIGTKKELLVFVEVKMRTKSYFDLSHVITHHKQHKIIKTAQQYLACNPSYLTCTSCRFDVALLEGVSYNLTYIPDAFRS